LVASKNSENWQEFAYIGSTKNYRKMIVQGEKPFLADLSAFHRIGG
jgi:hypothetical protein